MRWIDDTSFLSSAGILKISWEFLPFNSKRVHTYCYAPNLILQYCAISVNKTMSESTSEYNTGDVEILMKYCKLLCK